MSMNVAMLDDANVVVAINVQASEYELAHNEVVVTGAAYVGGTYLDGIFYPPQPYASWVRVGGSWAAPVQKPDGPNLYRWDEPSLSWVEVTA